MKWRKKMLFFRYQPTRSLLLILLFNSRINSKYYLKNRENERNNNNVFLLIIMLALGTTQYTYEEETIEHREWANSIASQIKMNPNNRIINI